MEPGVPDPEAALRPLRSADDSIDALRAGGYGVEGARGLVLRVADAVEQSLRRLLRDATAAPVEVRLRALAEDEMREAEVLSELRQVERISLDVAAAAHQLFETRRRLRQGFAVEPADPPLAVRVADLLQTEARTPPERPAPTVPAPPPPPAADATLAASPPAPPRRRSRFARVAAVLGVVAALLVVAFLARPREPNELDRGIALFRSGAYADAASHFWRYAEANPDDVTPHLYLARIHRRMGRTDLAAQALRTATGIAPQDPDVHRELGFLLLDTGRPEVAVERFREVVVMDPDSPDGWVGLVRALRESGRPDAAERALQQAPAEVRALLETRGIGAGR